MNDDYWIGPSELKRKRRVGSWWVEAPVQDFTQQATQITVAPLSEEAPMATQDGKKKRPKGC